MGLPKSPVVKVNVTESIIAESKSRDSSHCMIAEGLKAAVPHAKYILVDLQSIRFTDTEKKLRYTYLTPRSAQIALIKFDQGITPPPLEFTLRKAWCQRTR